MSFSPNFHSGLHAEKQKPMLLVFKDVKLECGYRIDILVERKGEVEIKSVETLKDVHLGRYLPT
jgi:GxxExxY protein